MISGESGAGKTVSSNFLVQHLAELGKVRERNLVIVNINIAIFNSLTGDNNGISLDVIVSTIIVILFYFSSEWEQNARE